MRGGLIPNGPWQLAKGWQWVQRQLCLRHEGLLGARLVVSGERSTTNRPKGMRGGRVSHACAFRLFGRLEGIAAQPLRYCRLTAHYLHQNAATPNKGKNKTKQEKNNQHERVRGVLLVFHHYCFQFQVCVYLIQSWVISVACL